MLDEARLSASSSTVSLPVVPLAPEASTLPPAALVAVILQLWALSSAMSSCRDCFGRLQAKFTTFGKNPPGDLLP